MTKSSLPRFGKTVLAMGAAALLLTPAIAGNGNGNGNNGNGRYLIQYTPANEQALKNMIEDMGGEVVFDYSAVFPGLAADMTPAAKKTLRQSGLATTIEDDVIFELHGQAFEDGGIDEISPNAIPAGFPNGAFDEFVPWGRDRVEADRVWSTMPNLGTADNDVAGSDVRANPDATGAGVVVGVLDTGIDYGHEDLDANVIDDRANPDGAIRNFVENLPGAEDLTFNGHGTSVASVIASVDNEVGLIGVAPNAQIRPYRVCDGGCSLAAITGGLVQATIDGVDVINMSFGGSMQQSFYIPALNAANREGIVLVASAGNGASQVVQSPAGVGTVLAVGATDINDNPASFTNTGGWVDVTAPGVNNPTATCEGCVITAVVDEISPTAQSFSANTMTGSPFASGPGIINVNAEMVDADPVNLGCTPIAADLTGKIALISRGACSFAAKVGNAEAAGAAATIIYNSNPGNFNGTLGAFVSAGPALSISNADGVTLVAEIAGGVTTANVDAFRDNSILYNFISGTSFSSPHVAGIAALIKEVNPGLSPIEVRKVITQTAEDIGHQNIFGAGMARADLAVAAAQE